MERIGWVSIISGGGSTMEAMAEEVIERGIATDERRIEPRLVIATNAKAGGLELAAKRGIKTEVVDPKTFADRHAFGNRMRDVIYDAGGKLVTLNGCLARMEEETVIEYLPPEDEFDPETGEIKTGKLSKLMANQHPGPLPATEELYAVQPHHAMLLYRRMTGTESVSEVVAHMVVSDQFDKGPILGAAPFPIRKLDNPLDMQERGKKVEQAVQKRLLWDFVRGTNAPAQTIDMTMDRYQRNVLNTARNIAQMTWPKS